MVEVRYLKRELLEHPEAPVPPRPSSSSGQSSADVAADLRKRLAAATAKVDFLRDDAERAAASHRNEVRRQQMSKLAFSSSL